VVQVRVGGLDYLRSLARARDLSPRLALVTYGDSPAELQQFSRLFGLDITLRHYRTETEAADVVRELKALGVQAVVAPGLVTDLAEEAGLHGVFLYSHDAVREALDDAVEIARAARLEAAKRERLNTILAQLRDGVVAVDLQERIETLNPAMARLLGHAPSELVGRRLGEVAHELSLVRTLREGQPQLDDIQPFGGATLVTSRMPIVEQGVMTGAVLTCQDTVAIQRVERSLRGRRPSPGTARHTLASLVGEGPAMRQALALAAQYARSDATVLVVGESGTGKELLAQGVHAASRRAKRPFVAINCGALPETLLESELFGYEDGAFTGARKGGKPGLFEAAHTGTLFLDEVGEMPPSLQTRLLRVLQEREVLRIGATEATPVDVRVIAATHRDLAERIGAGAFRRDLYYRLNILRLALPALRERREDLPALADHLLDRVAQRLRVPAERVRPLVQSLLRQGAGYDWPGNVRELENLIERLASCAPDDAGDHAALLSQLAPEVIAGPASPLPASGGLGEVGREAERRRIEQVLADCGGNKQLACERLGIGRTTLWRRLKATGLA
jgi:propionate catabolism operon transcriptional regulator